MSTVSSERDADAASSLAALGETLRSDATVMLADRGCPACRHADHAESGFLRWFAMETHTERAMLDRLRESLGMCPAHTRRLLEVEGAATVLIPVYRHVLPGALRRLEPHSADPIAPCHVCLVRDSAAVRAVEVVGAGTVGEGLESQFVHAGGFCVPHLLVGVGELSEAALTVALDTARARLKVDAPREVISLLAGLDTDAAARWRLRGSLPDAGKPSATTSVRERWAARLAVDACPICLAEAQTERSYLDWLTTDTSDARPQSDSCRLCPAHLHDVDLLNPRVAEWVAEHMRGEFLIALERMLEPTPSSNHSRWRRARPEPSRPIPPALQRHCSACRAAEVVAARELELLLTLLDEPVMSSRYRNSHGLCLRHVLSLPESAPPDLRAAARTRLAVLQWEVNEASRKRAWGQRHEPQGSEHSAWQRAAAQLDGRVYGGGPPR